MSDPILTILNPPPLDFPSALAILRLILLVLLGLLSLFAVLMIRQTSLLDAFLKTRGGPAIKKIAFLYLLIIISTFVTGLFILR